MDAFIRQLERMQRTQDRHLVRIGRQITHIARSGGGSEVMALVVENLQAREERKLDPAARELVGIVPPSWVHYEKAVDLLIDLIGVMATKLNGTTLHHVETAAQAGFALLVILDDVDFADGLTNQGRDVQAMRIFAQFMCALKGWLLLTERLIERAATLAARRARHNSDPSATWTRNGFTVRRIGPHTPKEPRPPEGA